MNIIDKRMKLLFLKIAFCLDWFLRTKYFHILDKRIVFANSRFERSQLFVFFRTRYFPG